MDLWALSDLSTPWCVHVAATLDIARHLEAGQTEIAALSAAAGADEDSLRRVLRHLIRAGVFAEPAPDRFALNDAARPLLEEGFRLGLNLDSFGGRMAGAWNTLLSAVRSGSPAYHEAFGRAFWDDLDAHPAISADFDALMGPAGHGTPDADLLPDPAGWAAVRHVVDVGGGTGALLAQVLLEHEQVRGTLVDLPRTVARSAALFEAAGVAGRVTVAAQSFFDPLPAGADVYVLKSVLCDWPDGEAARILGRCCEAARPGGRVIVLSNAGPGEEASPELLMMVLAGGRDRTLGEIEALARSAGLAVTATRRQAGGRLLVECRPDGAGAGEPRPAGRPPAG